MLVALGITIWPPWTMITWKGTNRFPKIGEGKSCVETTSMYYHLCTTDSRQQQLLPRWYVPRTTRVISSNSGLVVCRFYQARPCPQGRRYELWALILYLQADIPYEADRNRSTNLYLAIWLAKLDPNMWLAKVIHLERCRPLGYSRVQSCSTKYRIIVISLAAVDRYLCFVTISETKTTESIQSYIPLETQYHSKMFMCRAWRMASHTTITFEQDLAQKESLNLHVWNALL